MKFQSERREMQELSTAALPDIVFILLFFFMTTTTFKNNAIQVQNQLPSASEVQHLEGAEKAVVLYVGRPLKSSSEASAVIQLNDRVLALESLESEVLKEINTKPQYLKAHVEVIVKVDQGVKLSVVQQIKEKMSQLSVRKVHYVAQPTTEG